MEDGTSEMEAAQKLGYLEEVSHHVVRAQYRGNACGE